MSCTIRNRKRWIFIIYEYWQDLITPAFKLDEMGMTGKIINRTITNEQMREFICQKQQSDLLLLPKCRCETQCERGQGQAGRTDEATGVCCTAEQLCCPSLSVLNLIWWSVEERSFCVRPNFPITATNRLQHCSATSANGMTHYWGQ